jgi:hypothetical protein
MVCSWSGVNGVDDLLLLVVVVAMGWSEKAFWETRRLRKSCVLSIQKRAKRRLRQSDNSPVQLSDETYFLKLAIKLSDKTTFGMTSGFIK